MTANIILHSLNDASMNIYYFLYLLSWFHNLVYYKYNNACIN